MISVILVSIGLVFSLSTNILIHAFATKLTPQQLTIVCKGIIKGVEDFKANNTNYKAPTNMSKPFLGTISVPLAV